MEIEISVGDPASPEARALLERHLTFAHEVTPKGGVFALDLDALRAPRVTFFCAHRDGDLVGVAALQELEPGHGELKSMHTAERARRHGVGLALVKHVLDVARARQYRRVSLETGNFPAFAPARALYAQCGFMPCDPYGPYVGSSTSACMTIALAESSSS